MLAAIFSSNLTHTSVPVCPLNEPNVSKTWFGFARPFLGGLSLHLNHLIA